MAGQPTVGWGDFLWEGLTTTTASSFYGAIALTLFELLVATVFLTPRNLARLNPKMIMSDEDDDYGRVTVLATRLRWHPSDRLGVVYVGSSTAHRALFDSYDPRPIEKDLEKQLGQPVTFYSLYAHSSLLSEQLVVLEQIPEDFRGVVAIMVYDDKDDAYWRKERVKQGIVGERLGLDSPSAGLVTTVQAPTGIYFLDHLAFFAARRTEYIWFETVWRRSLRGGAPHPYPPLDGVEKRMFANRRKDMTPMLRHSLDTLERMLETAHKPGTEVVVVEAPGIPEYEEMKGKERARYLGDMQDLTKRYDAEFWDLNDEAGIRRFDFQDGVHLGNPAARMRFQNIFVDRIAEVLRRVP